MDPASVQVLAFDVFGTVVDFRSTIVDEGAEVTARTGIALDWAAFADAWRSGYQPAMQRVRSGERPWTRLDDLHREVLDELLEQLGGAALGEDERVRLNLAWHRLRPWPDSVAGLTRLRRRYVLTTLSNGNVRLLVDIAKRAGLPWDMVLSAELVQAYKPDPRTYGSVHELLDVRPEQAMLVACHPDDLRAAASHGLRTAYVARPYEHGPGTAVPTADDVAGFDVRADDLTDLAAQLGC